jgi:hypothetical protein
VLHLITVSVHKGDEPTEPHVFEKETILPSESQHPHLSYCEEKNGHFWFEGGGSSYDFQAAAVLNTRMCGIPQAVVLPLLTLIPVHFFNPSLQPFNVF